MPQSSKIKGKKRADALVTIDAAEQTVDNGNAAVSHSTVAPTKPGTQKHVFCASDGQKTAADGADGENVVVVDGAHDDSFDNDEAYDDSNDDFNDEYDDDFSLCVRGGRARGAAGGGIHSDRRRLDGKRGPFSQKHVRRQVSVWMGR
jgi:hypothetical protein